MNSPTKFILAVDDDDNDLFWMSEAIAGASVGDFTYHLSKASNAFEARSILADLVLHRCVGDEIIVFSDVNMPSESGLQFLQWLKAQPEFREIPVIIISSFDRRAEIIRAFELGAVACMLKPPQSSAVKGLLNTIRQLSSGKNHAEPFPSGPHITNISAAILASPEQP